VELAPKTGSVCVFGSLGVFGNLAKYACLSHFYACNGNAGKNCHFSVFVWLAMEFMSISPVAHVSLWRRRMGAAGLALACKFYPQLLATFTSLLQYRKVFCCDSFWAGGFVLVSARR